MFICSSYSLFWIALFRLLCCVNLFYTGEVEFIFNTAEGKCEVKFSLGDSQLSLPFVRYQRSGALIFHTVN
jgi:hypothetical protein